MSRQSPAESVWAGALGVWLALTLLKLGTPVILDSQVPAPTTLDEVLVASWPVRWGYFLTAAALLVGIHRFRWPRGVPLWLMLAPLLWLSWQALSATRSLGTLTDPAERRIVLHTLGHFTICAAGFYYGVGVAASIRRLAPLWLALGGGFVVVLIVGWQQHFGGLEETRQFFFSQPDWRRYPPEFIQKISSDRIYGTLFYPNALAGVILLLLPVCLAQAWGTTRNSAMEGAKPLVKPQVAKQGQTRQGCPTLHLLFWAAWACIAVMAGASLYWSGSKAGWLILLGQCLVTLVWSPMRLRTKSILLGAILVLGLAGFGLRYQAYFAKGATSAAARVDYWRVAWQGLAEKPFLGSGPGTFAATYKRLKPREAELTRLAHNDLLQQGSDSGWIGMLAYLAWLYGGVGFLGFRLLRHRPATLTISRDWVRLGIWTGLVGITAQSLVEFWLYIPASAWPTFFLMGLLTGTPPPEAERTTSNAAR